MLSWVAFFSLQATSLSLEGQGGLQQPSSLSFPPPKPDSKTLPVLAPKKQTKKKNREEIYVCRFLAHFETIILGGEVGGIGVMFGWTLCTQLCPKKGGCC